MSFSRPADEYALRRMKRARIAEDQSMMAAIKATEAQFDKTEAEFLARKNKPKQKPAPKPPASAVNERADTAWLLTKYVELNPDAKQILANYIPTATKAEMEATQKATDYRNGWYTNGRVQNDAEAWMVEHNLMKGGWGYNITHAARFLWSGEEKLEQARKTATTYANQAYDGKTWDERAQSVANQPFVDTLWDAYKGRNKGNKNNNTIGSDAVDTSTGMGLGQIPQIASEIFSGNGSIPGLPSLWDLIKEGLAGIPVYVDVALILGGVAFTYFGLTDGAGSLAIPGIAMIGVGSFLVYCYMSYKRPASDTKASPSGNTAPLTSTRDAMGNDQLLIPTSKH